LSGCGRILALDPRQIVGNLEPRELVLDELMYLRAEALGLIEGADSH